MDHKCIIEVLNMDTLEGAFDLQSRGYHPVLHNMCNPNVRGGFYHLVGSQEEDLIRRGNYLHFLQREKYPIGPHNVIYSSGVKFTKKGYRERYREYETEKYMDIIACPAIINNGIGICLNPDDEQLMKYKIDLIFSTAVKYGHDSIVLSAFGCGGFRCPPEHVSLLFKEAIDKWKLFFKVIRFCIFDENYPKSNYDVFRGFLEKSLAKNNQGVTM